MISQKLNEFFRSIDTKKYVAVSGHDSLGKGSEHSMLLLVDNIQSFVSGTGLVKDGADDRYVLNIGPQSEPKKETLRLHLIPKGCGYVPDRFFSQVIDRTEHYECVKIPRGMDALSLMLYTILYRSGDYDEGHVVSFSDFHWKLIQKFVNDRVGLNVPYPNSAHIPGSARAKFSLTQNHISPTS